MKSVPDPAVHRLYLKVVHGTEVGAYGLITERSSKK
jgi:hypothetical protein